MMNEFVAMIGIGAPETCPRDRPNQGRPRLPDAGREGKNLFRRVRGDLASEDDDPPDTRRQGDPVPGCTRAEPVDQSARQRLDAVLRRHDHMAQGRRVEPTGLREQADLIGMTGEGVDDADRHRLACRAPRRRDTGEGPGDGAPILTLPPPSRTASLSGSRR